MKKQWAMRVLGAAVCSMVACTPMATDHAMAWSPKALLQTHWLHADPVLGSQPVSLDIASTGQISGNAGCNRYIGNAEIGLRTLRWVKMGRTNRYCFQPGVMEAEDRFFRAMEQTRSGRLEQGQLLLLDEAGQVLWRLNPQK